MDPVVNKDTIPNNTSVNLYRNFTGDIRITVIFQNTKTITAQNFKN